MEQELHIERRTIPFDCCLIPYHSERRNGITNMSERRQNLLIIKLNDDERRLTLSRWTQHIISNVYNKNRFLFLRCVGNGLRLSRLILLAVVG